MANMAKTNKLSKIFVVLLFVVVAVALTFAFVNVPIGAANAEEISITIYNKGNGEIYSTESQRTSEWRYRSGNGSVTYNGETITAEDAKNTPEKTITANITEEGLQVKAEAQQDSLFFCWATDAEAKNIVSMRSEDTFTYEEVQSFQEKELYAFFVPILGEDVRAAAQFQITYDDTLGDVYFFSGKENVENETLKKHGLPIPSGQLIDIPFVQREVWSTRQEPATLSTTSREVSNLTFAAIPKTEIDSTIDLSRKTSAVFKEWSATYSAYQNRELLSQENRSLPEICDTSQNSSSIDPDGSKQYFPNQQTPVDGTWFCSSISVGRSLESGISFSPEKVYGNTNTNWLINPFNNMEEYSGTISVLPQTISAEFQEVAIVPEIEVTPYVNDEMKDPITFDRESTEHITFYYGQKNSINAIFVNSDQLVKQPEYQVKQTLLDGTTGKYTSKTISVTNVMGTVNGFNISEIDNSCTITIIPNYGEEYYIDTFTITVDLVTENGYEDIVSKESEPVTVVSGDDWYFNPQFTANGVYTFTSGISYQVDLSKKSDSQLHFQVKGSGVFTFEFYLDGAGMEPYMPPAYAVYGTGSQINKNGITSGSFGDNTTALAKGNTEVGSLTDIHYYPCTILAVDKVTRIDEVTDWCRASIAVTAENDDTVTDIYVAHIATPYNAQYGTIFGPHTAMSVRNVAYYQGHSDVSWDIYDNANGDKSGWGTISAQSGGKEASQTDLTSGTMIDFSINYDDVSYKFYGWSDGAELLSTEKEFSYTVKGKTDGSSKTKICAVLAPTNQPYSYRTGGEFYDENNLENALTMAAERSANVYVLRSVEIKTSVTIAPNVNLVIPFDGTNRLHGSADEKDDVQEKISWLVDGDTYKYFTVTIAEEAILTVNGGLYLGGVVNYPSQTYQGHTSGAYSEIVNNGKIVIDDGGIMDVYGHVTGNGSIEVNKNAKLYEPFLILDYAGGTNTLGIFSAGQTPFKRYAMINIECPMTINYGGMLYGHATLYALSAFFSLDQPFVSYDMGSDMGGDGFGHDTIIMLTEGASVTITYNSKKVVHSEVATNCTEGIGQTKLVFDGGAIFSYMLFSAMGLEIPTNSVYFSIPYNFEVEMNGKDAVYETKTDFMIMPGATVKVGTGATLTLNANAWIFDGMVQGVLDGKSYPKANELEIAGYSKNGNLIVDGTLRIGQKTTVEGFDFGSLFGGSGSSSFVPQEIPATFLGVVQTNGTGKIEIPEKTILQATIIDGIENRTYFSYTTTARVWDAAHGCFADLVAGNTYTATGNAEFKLDSIKYANTKGGEDTLTLTLDQEMHGSWMEVHEGHVLDWTPNAEKDEYSKLGPEKLHKLLSRQCSVMGCNHSEEKELLFGIGAFDNVTYKGAAYTDAELLDLLKRMFKDLDGSFGATFAMGEGAIEGKLLNVPISPYQIKVTLTNAYWLIGESYETATTLTLMINPYALNKESGKNDDITVEELKDGKLPSKTYTGNQLTYDSLTIKFKGQPLAATKDYTIGNGSNVTVDEGGKVTVTGVQNSNFTGAFTLEFVIDRADISGGNITVNETYTYGGQAIVPARGDLTIGGVQGFDDNVITAGDVDITAQNNLNAGEGTATVTVSGKGNFTGSLSANFSIEKRAVSLSVIHANGTYGDVPKEMTFTLEGFVDGEEDIVREAVSITHTANQWSNVGSYDVDVKVGDLTNYAVSVKDSSDKKAYAIDAKSIAGATVKIAGDKTFSYNGQNITPTVGDVEVTLSGWEHEITFSVAATNNLNAGEASFTVTGTENYSGTSNEGSFTINPAKVHIEVNSLSSPQGDELLETYDFRFLEDTRFFGDDEQIFRNNISGYNCNADKNIVGKDYVIEMQFEEPDLKKLLPNYDITVENGTYAVNDSIFKDVAFEENTVTYDGNKHTLTAQGTEKIEGEPHVVYEYQQGETPVDGAWQTLPDGGFADAGKYSIRVTITVDGHESKYQETRLLTIEPKDIKDATVTVDGAYTYTGKAITIEKSNIKVNLDKWSLPIEFDIVADGYSNNTNATSEVKATVKITGTGNYKGEATGEFIIAKRSIADGTLTAMGSYTYDGNQQTPQGEALSVTLQDFENGAITFQVKAEGGYANNINATTATSKATVTVEGTGNFNGELSAQFDIEQATITGVEVQNPEAYFYNKTPIAPTLTVKSGELTLNDGDYTIEYTTAEQEHTNAGTVSFKVTGKGNFKGERTSTFEIKAKQITVKVLKQTSVYSGVSPQVSSEKGIGWDVDDNAICDGDDLHIELSAEGLTAAVRTYTINPKYENNNYSVSWDLEAAEFEITPATITITVKDAYSKYGDPRASLEIEATGICASDSTLNINDYVTLACDVDEMTGFGTYDITCTKKGADPVNYTIAIANTGTYTVDQKDITVTINDQDDIYNFQNAYKWDPKAWTVDEKTLANGEKAAVLDVKLTKPALNGAGTYAIAATYNNSNYNVTFKGEWAKEDENKYKAGVYTIAKKTLDHDGENVIFMLAIDGVADVEEKRSEKFGGEALELSAHIYVKEGTHLNEITGYELSQNTLTAVGTYSIVVTIKDDNYAGSRTFTVEVLTAEGYSQALSDALEQLKELVGDDLTADTLTEEHFAIVKQVKSILDELSEDDKKSDQLAKYQNLVNAWNEAASISDDVIDTAKDIADSPIKWLFALAEISALLAAIFVVGKGGLM